MKYYNAMVDQLYLGACKTVTNKGSVSRYLFLQMVSVYLWINSLTVQAQCQKKTSSTSSLVTLPNVHMKNRLRIYYCEISTSQDDICGQWSFSMRSTLTDMFVLPRVYFFLSGKHFPSHGRNKHN